MSTFEERLLVELRSLVAAPPAGGGRRRALWRRPRVVVAGGLAAAAAAVVAGVLVFSTGTQAAYAVTKNADGTVTVEIDSLTDAAGLQAKLQEAGVNAVVEYLPEGKICRQPWYTPAGRGAEGAEQTSSVQNMSDGTIRFTIGRDRPAGSTLVITTQTGPGNLTALGLGYAQGDVPACQVVDAPAAGGPLGGPPAGP